MRVGPGGVRGVATCALTALVSLVPLASGAASALKPQEDAIRQVVASYEQAIETKDITLFRSVKPNLSDDEERRLRKAFGSTRKHEVTITIEAIDCKQSTCVARLMRRDTLDGSIVSSFPQALHLGQGPGGWVIEAIGR